MLSGANGGETGENPKGELEMIVIKRPFVSKVEGSTRVTSLLCIDGVETSLWVEVEDQYASGLCSDRVDGFVIALLPLAFKFKHDIMFEAPITDLLKEQLEKDFIDVICEHQSEVYHVKLIGPTIAPIYKRKTVRAMGLSCGVDCLYTVHNRMLDASLGARYFVMSNAHMRSKDDSDESAAKRFKPLYDNGKAFADKLGIPLIVVRTNWGPQVIADLRIENNTTFCNVFVAYCLQNLFSLYFLASGGPIKDFAVKYVRNGIFKTDCSNYDLLALSAYSTPSLRFIVDGLEERVSKIRALLEWEECWNNLDVCEKHKRLKIGNDTYDCHKCMHTVNEIMSQGGIEGLKKFKNVFDINYVLSHRAEYLAYLICQRIERSEIGMEAWRGKAREGCSFATYIVAIGIIIRKAFRKLVPSGKVPASWADI